MSDKITTLIVDDHTVVRKGVRAFLETQVDIEIVGEAESGEAAVKLCQEVAPDVVLLDLLMPGINGVETTRQIKQISPRTNIVVLTSYHDDEHILPAVRAGALSYLLKDIDPQELGDAVRRAAAGEVTLHPRVAAKLMQGLQSGIQTEGLPATDLSPSEIAVLKLLAEGIANSEIASRLFISEKTVKSHVSNILSKLHLQNRTQAAIFALRNGLI
jgi:two-component system, NarL family, response regulator LiaR